MTKLKRKYRLTIVEALRMYKQANPDNKYVQEKCIQLTNYFCSKEYPRMNKRLMESQNNEQVDMNDTTVGFPTKGYVEHFRIEQS